ncbi:MAG: zinc-ribbon domain-containing protein [Pseudomonadota bacterium]
MSLSEELVKSWHPQKNGGLAPLGLSPMSNKKVWWICAKGHEWQAAINNRAGRNKTGCPYCAGKRTTKDNNLAVLFPDLLSEWHFDKNESMKPEQALPYSHKKVWWRCSKGHEWRTGIAYRTKQKSGCPYCSGRSVGTDNSLAALYPELVKEWHPEKNAGLTPKDATSGTDRKVWWLCSEGHSWEAAICHRTHSTKATGCPYCSGRNATKENNLAILFPELVREWHFKRNDPLRPETLKPGSNRKVWWQCSRGHEWKISPNRRTGADKTGCPYCNPQTSRLEIRILCELRFVFENVQWRTKIGGSEADIYVPKYSFAIEVDGYRWHIGKEEKDRIKGQELRKNGVKLLRLRDRRLSAIEDTDTFCNENEEDIDITQRLCTNITKHIPLSNDDHDKIQAYCLGVTLQNNTEYERFVSYLPSPPPENSLAALYKNLIPEWHYEKNAPLTPENFTPSARANVWWKCPNGHEYKSFLYNRIKGVGCPYCAGKKVCSDNNLAVRAPQLLQEWNFLKNAPLEPGDVYYRSTKEVWWICKKGHVWKAEPRMRVRGRGCPYCGGRKRDSQDHGF